MTWHRKAKKGEKVRGGFLKAGLQAEGNNSLFFFVVKNSTDYLKAGIMKSADIKGDVLNVV